MLDSNDCASDASIFGPSQTIYAAHWPQLEQPSEFNAILRRWLESLTKSDSTDAKRYVDEL